MRNISRRQQAHNVRIEAANVARDRVHPEHVASGDEFKFRKINSESGKNEPSLLVSFTKGMPHDPDTGLVKNADAFLQFVKAVDSGDPRDFIDTPLGHEHHFCCEHWCDEHSEELWQSDKAKDNAVSVRAWESQGAGNTFDLEGPDAQAVTMPPAPALGSTELTAEMAEVYGQALLRDVPFNAFSAKSGSAADRKSVSSVVDILNSLDWFNPTVVFPDDNGRRRTSLLPHTAFRGITPGDNVGPYLSQFLLAGNKGLTGNRDRAEGLISYGAARIDQRVRAAKKAVDYMTCWPEWLDVQNGADFRGMEEYDGTKHRFIATPRDLATYVHYDALYQAYLNATLLLLGEGTPLDPGIPFQRADAKDHQQGFAHFGGPHILSLVTEVATRALKAVRFQKFNIHRRCRPEVLAARIQKFNQLGSTSPELTKMYRDLKACNVLDRIFDHNEKQNASQSSRANKKGTYLLPMAFCEGSPMHPSYGAGHATVAGACTTILKAFFDHRHPLSLAGSPSHAFVPDRMGKALESVDVVRPAPTPRNPNNCEPATLWVEGELNKLASNISIGRDWAGVHYFTDYIESLRMGERIALGILEEQKLTYGENFSMTVPLFDGGAVRI